MALASGTRLGPYEIIERVGAGGMGEVYRARDPRLSREVAVKLISTDGATSPDRLRRFETEARAAAQLSHPNVVTVFDVGTHEGQPYLVLELLDGETLGETLRGGTPPLRQAVTWALEISRGLAAAHERGIVHRDLKPDNVFLTKDGRVKVLDFGLAKLREPLVSDEADRESPTATRDTSPGVLLGTVGYMSPEQVKGQTPDPRTDVFALGTVLYEMVSGRRAFSGETAPEVLAAILRDEPPALESLQHGVPAAVETVARRCLAKRPADRFSSARAVEAALETALATLEPSRVSVSRAAESRGPYPGLSSFTEADAERFFGREEEVEALWEKLRRGRLLAVIGPSGAGKTSFVRAGLVPARPSGWGAIVATPGGAPMRALAQALVGELPSDADTTRQLLGFDDPDVAFSMVKKWGETHLEAVLVLDQFEELFTLCPMEVQERFAALIGRLVGEADVHVLFSLRDDFLMRCDGHDALHPVFGALTPLSPLSEEGLRRALLEPAKREGFAFEDGALVAEMLESVEGARGALPLLAFAVARLWEKRDREKKLLTRKAYDEIGGVAGALAQHAEQTLERIGLKHEPLVRELFRNLVTAQWTRAVADREELLSVSPDREAGAQVLDLLIDARLLTSYEVRATKDPAEGSSTSSDGSATESRQRVEIVHESLLRAWPRLVRWQAQDEEGAVLRDQLKQAASLWDEKGRPDDLLWTGTSEREFELWRDRYPGKLTSLEEEFARTMVARTRKRKRLRTAALGTLVVGLAAVAIAIAVSRQNVAAARDVAEASRVLALGELRLDEDPTEALAFATASLEIADSAEARTFAVRALWEAPPALDTGEGRECLGPFSPDGTRLAAGGFGSEVLLWNDDGTGPARLSGHTVRTQRLASAWTTTGLLVTGHPWHEDRVRVWSADGEHLRTIDFGGTTQWQTGPTRLLAQTMETDPAGKGNVVWLRSWHLPDGEAEDLGRIDMTAVGATHGLIEPEGRGWFYARGPEVRYRPLPLAAHSEDRLLARHGAEIVALGHPESDPDTVASADASGETRVWSLTGRGPFLEKRILRPQALPEDARYFTDPSGEWISNMPHDVGQAHLWNAAMLPGGRPLRLRRGGSWYASGGFFHPCNDWYVVAAGEGLSMWPLRRPYPSVVEGYTGVRQPLAFSPDGQWLATDWPGSPPRLWPLPGNDAASFETVDVPDGVWASIAFDPRGRALFLVGLGGRVQLAPLDGRPSRRFEWFPEGTMLEAAAFSPSGRLVATGFSFGEGEMVLRIWDTETGDLRTFDLPSSNHPEDGPPPEYNMEQADRFTRSVVALRFMDEHTLLSVGAAGLRRWDLETGAQKRLGSGAWGEIPGAALSADGRLALTSTLPMENFTPILLQDLAGGTSEPLPRFGEHVTAIAMDDAGTVIVSGDVEGTVRVGRLPGREPHLLLGHRGLVTKVALSSDLSWVASTGEDGTLRLWPMPDLDAAPLHTLPHNELLAKLKSLTNIRAVRAPEEKRGWAIEVDPFPGWRDVPSW